MLKHYPETKQRVAPRVRKQLSGSQITKQQPEKDIVISFTVLAGVH